MDESWTEVELHGGPLDGEHIPVDTNDPEPETGLPLVADGCSILGGRSWYAPDPATGRWTWVGDTH